MNSRVIGSPGVVKTIQSTPPLIPHALPSAPTPPSGVDTQLPQPPRADAARTIDTSHGTPTKSEKNVDVEQAEEPAVNDESMDAGEASSQKRQTTGRYRVRNKEEVMGESSDSKVDKISMDSRDKLGDEVAGCKYTVDNELRSTVERSSDLQMMSDPKTISLEAAQVPDLGLLYATLVHDGAVPNGYLEPFLSLGINSAQQLTGWISAAPTSPILQLLNGHTV